MLEIHTNNLVESWHNILKSVYLKGTRKQRTDILVYRPLEEVLKDLRIKVALTQNGFLRRRTNLVEQRQQDESNLISDEVALRYVTRFYSSENSDEIVEKISVKSFSTENVFYTIKINEDGLLSNCSCPVMTLNGIICKHLNLAARILGHQINYETRSNDVQPDIHSTQAPTLEVEAIEPQNDISNELDQIVSRLRPFVNKYHDLDDQDRDVVRNFLDTFHSFEKNFSRQQSSWSQKQRR